MERRSSGQAIYWNDSFKEVSLSLAVDPTADQACIADPFAVLRLWSGNGLLSPWCVYCQKWLGSSHLLSVSHGKGLQYYPSGLPPEAMPHLTSLGVLLLIP